MRSNLCELRLGAGWSEMPAAIARLPLTKLCLYGFKFKTDSLQERLAGGFTREFTQLAPTLKVWTFTAGLLSASTTAIHSFAWAAGLRRLL